MHANDFALRLHPDERRQGQRGRRLRARADGRLDRLCGTCHRRPWQRRAAPAVPELDRRLTRRTLRCSSPTPARTTSRRSRIAPRGIDLVGPHRGRGAPTSIAIHGDLVYVLTTGDDAGVRGFRLGGRRQARRRCAGGALELSAPDADPAQVAFSPDGATLVVSERGHRQPDRFAIAADGARERAAASSRPPGPTPYGFEFTSSGALVVTEAAGGQVGAASASSYRLDGPGRLAAVSGPVPSTRSEVCWAAVSKDDRYAYVTNFGDGTISSYAIGEEGDLSLLDPVAATTVDGRKGIRDEAFSSDGEYLYALHADARRIFGWSVGDDGSLDPIGAFGDLPETVAGLAVI